MEIHPNSVNAYLVRNLCRAAHCVRRKHKPNETSEQIELYKEVVMSCEHLAMEDVLRRMHQEAKKSAKAAAKLEQSEKLRKIKEANAFIRAKEIEKKKTEREDD
eukprot:UN15855